MFRKTAVREVKEDPSHRANRVLQAFSLGVATAQGGFNMLASSLNQFIAPQLGQ